MQLNTISFSGFSREESAQLEALLKQAREAIGEMWSIEAENDAQVVVADMDSMYGQMGFLKARGNGKTTVGVTSGARNDADHLLARPVNADSLQTLLKQLASVLPKQTLNAPREVEDAVAARITGQQPALPPRTTGQQPAMPPLPERTTGQQPAMDARSTAERAAVAAPPAEPAPPPPPADVTLNDLLRQGRNAGAIRLQADGAPALIIDFDSQTYGGGTALKPLQPYAGLVIKPGVAEELSAAEAETAQTAAGGKQPIARLQWFIALQSGKGRLQAGFDPNARYKLDKWPQTEREFPKHFRIATVMMKGPATLTEIAEQSGSPLNEVIDFVNASLTSGHTSAA